MRCSLLHGIVLGTSGRRRWSSGPTVPSRVTTVRRSNPSDEGQTPPVRHTVLDKLWPGWPPWRRALNLRRGIGDTAPSPSELVANACFGRVAEHERMALERLIAGCSAQVAGTEPPDQDPTESVS